MFRVQLDHWHESISKVYWKEYFENTIFSERELTLGLYAVARLSVVCLSAGNARAPYSGGCNFPQYFNALGL